MAKYVITSKRGAPPQGAYSQGWRAGDFVFVTGTGPVDPATNKMWGETIEEQTELTIRNMESILQADGASLADVVKVTAHLSDITLFSRYNTTYASIFQKPYPVRTTVESGFADPKMMIELDCVAYAPKSGPSKKTSAKKPAPKKMKKR
ncbi:MAG TPA: RidA family protein [Candidatus Acidoferrum sp.]|nr:RidA family protein [Candidatus Acidoferrum sp.]